jgi:hypothetical protein
VFVELENTSRNCSLSIRIVYLGTGKLRPQPAHSTNLSSLPAELETSAMEYSKNDSLLNR